MNVITRPIVAALLLLSALTITTLAQQKRPAPPKPQPKATPAPTFDTLVPAESYVIYGEVRGVGQLVRSNTINEALEPILKLAGPPKEFKTIVKWLNAHADEVMTSRLLVATWPVGKDLPAAIIAVEFTSAEEATKFMAPLNKILPTVLPPVAEPAPESQGENTKAPPVLRPDYHLQQIGSLILLTPKPITLNKLRPAGGKLLGDEINFRAARNRFNSESIFVFVDVKLMERQEEERRKQYAEMERKEAEQVKKEQAAAKVEEKPEEPEKPEETPSFVPQPQEEVVLEAQRAPGGTLVGPVASVKDAPDPVSTALSTLGSAFFSGESKWPDAVGIAVALESESFDVRALFVNQPGEKSDVVPIMPALIPGPPLAPESPNILPADTELFATMSLDLQQIYLAMSKPRPNSVYYTSRGNVTTVNEVAHESPFAAIEKRLKINLKDDLLPLLGSEVALSLPLTGFDLFGLPRGPGAAPEPKENEPRKNPVLLISLRDKEAMRALMPKLVDALGFKGASQFAQTERREDTELVSYMNLFAYAFIGNFLVLSPDAATTRHVVDSYLKHETLASETHFRTYTRWQPRPAHGQLYISPALMESYKTWAEQSNMGLSDQTRALLTRLTLVAQPITYSLSNEGLGPLHELHLPKNLVLMAVTGISGAANPPPVFRNEATAMGAMYMIAQAEERYKTDKGSGSYGTLEQLIAADMVSKEMIEGSGYKFEMTVTGDKFEVFAVPAEHGKTGNMSYFIDQTMVLRGANKSGASATSSDPPIR